jgi:hypothetical protein
MAKLEASHRTAAKYNPAATRTVMGPSRFQNRHLIAERISQVAGDLTKLNRKPVERE